MEYPEYACHKKVRAFMIGSIELLTDGGGGAIITSAAIATNRDWKDEQEAALPPITVDAAYMEKHKPEVGGYFVIYKDGYQSFSPAKAFEEGYSLDKNYMQVPAYVMEDLANNIEYLQKENTVSGARLRMFDNCLAMVQIASGSNNRGAMMGGDCISRQNPLDIAKDMIAKHKYKS